MVIIHNLKYIKINTMFFSFKFPDNLKKIKITPKSNPDEKDSIIKEELQNINISQSTFSIS